MKLSVFLCTLLGIVVCSHSSAEDIYDKMFINSGALDSKFKIINYDKYIEVTRLINNQFAKRMPAQVDSVTTYTMVKLSSAGLKISLELDGIESTKDLEEALDENLFKNMMKNRLCNNLPLLSSNFFKKTTKGDVSYEINSFDYKVLKTYVINQNECKSK